MVLCVVFLFRASYVFADNCTDIQNNINTLTQAMSENSTTYQQALNNIVLSPEANNQLISLKQDFDGQMEVQKEKNDASMSYYVTHYPKPNPGNQWNPNSGVALLQWTNNQEKLQSDNQKKLDAIENEGQKEISDLEAKLDSEYNVQQTNLYTSKNGIQRQQMTDLQNQIANCKSTVIVTAGSTLPNSTSSKIETNKKTVVAINKDSSIIIATTTTNIMRSGSIPTTEFEQPEPKLNIWQKIIKFFKKIF